MGEAERGEQRGGRSTTRFAYLFFRSLFAHRQHTVITQATTTKAAIPAITGTRYKLQNPGSTDLSIIRSKSYQQNRLWQGQNHIYRIHYDKVKIISTEFTISRSNIVHIYRIHKVKYCSYLQNSLQRGQNMIHVSCFKCCIYCHPLNW